MRLLDLGAHDGWIGSWLAERFDGEVHLDGVELHPQAAASARRRGYTTVIEGRAEDAPRRLERGSYDAVVLYELLEHVPDVDELLDAAEMMVRPGGRVFVSTPDGTFGTGHNPHHLRAVRSIDLADILRRRGRLHDLQVGVDDVTVAAYTPSRRQGDIAIYTGPSWLTWSPLDIARKGLGGSETAAVRLAHALSDLGFVVTVYGEVEQGCYSDVIYRHWSCWDPAVPRLATIASRMPEVFDRQPASRATLLWCHDIDMGPRLTAARAGRVDAILGLSRWHVDHLKGRYPFAAPKVLQTRNGIHLPHFAQPAARRRLRVLYTSSPDRGLDILLELWPSVRERVSRAELAFACSPFYDEAANQDPVVGAHRDLVRKLADQPGVIDLRSLPQSKLADAMLESMVWVAPSWSTPTGGPFHETSCIGAMEAQAAGLHVVASGWGALSETVQVGALVDGDPSSDRWRAAFVDEIVAGLTDRAVREHAQRAGPAHAASLGWEDVAVQVGRLVADLAR